MSRRSIRGIGATWLAVAALLVIVSVWQLAEAQETPEQISLAYCVDCVPFEFTNSEGQADGLIIDYWHLWSQKTGIAVEFIASPWGETLTNVRDGVADAHAGLFYSDERATYADSALSPQSIRPAAEVRLRQAQSALPQ